MNLALKIVLVLFGFLALDRILLFFERRYFAKYGRLITDFEEAEAKDAEKR